MTFHFPSQFIWGSATAGHQVEGNNINTDFWGRRACRRFAL